MAAREDLTKISVADAWLSLAMAGASRAERRDNDGWFLVRQLGAVRKQLEECPCRDNECPACVDLLKPVYAVLEQRTAAQKDKDPATYHAQLAKGLNRVPVQQPLLPEPPPPTDADRRFP
jgi:hypothetical protein